VIGDASCRHDSDDDDDDGGDDDDYPFFEEEEDEDGSNESPSTQDGCNDTATAAASVKGGKLSQPIGPFLPEFPFPGAESPTTHVGAVGGSPLDATNNLSTDAGDSINRLVHRGGAGTGVLRPTYAYSLWEESIVIEYYYVRVDPSVV